MKEIEKIIVATSIIILVAIVIEIFRDTIYEWLGFSEEDVELKPIGFSQSISKSGVYFKIHIRQPSIPNNAGY